MTVAELRAIMAIMPDSAEVRVTYNDTYGTSISTPIAEAKLCFEGVHDNKRVELEIGSVDTHK